MSKPATPNRQQPRAGQPVQKQRTGQNMRATTAKVVKVKPFNMPFEDKNVFIVIAGAATIVLGYFIMAISPTMSQLALTVAPIVLLIGYLIVVPYGIMYGSKTYKNERLSDINATPASTSNGIL